jgi:tetratricopeptide (TPR) repeat protein
MAAADRHLRVVGTRSADRLRCAASFGDAAVVARCDRRLRGPYTGVDTVLTALLPAAYARWPELVDEHRVELLYGIPELEELIGSVPQQLAFSGPFEHRTRFFGDSMIRCMSQGVVTFLLRYAQKVSGSDGAPLRLVFEDVHAAEVTTQEFVALLLRRSDPRLLQVVVCGQEGVLNRELADVLARFADTVQAPTGAAPRDDRSAEALVLAYVAADGSSDDAAEAAAYAAARSTDVEWIRALHDRRADELSEQATWGTKVGAIAFHRERGTDPGGSGREALNEAIRLCAEQGFSASIVDLGLRGRAVTDPWAEKQAFCEFTTHAASALVPLGRLDESLALYVDLRRRYTDPAVHMTTSYGIAMLYTRFFTPRDHDMAIAWQNNAIALSGLISDPKERIVHQVFNDNALALIEMHRGNLDHGLELVEAGIARLDAVLAPGEWVVHRSQLLYNRARLLAALGRTDEAYADFCTLVELDPYYTDYFSERAKIARRRGDIAAALRDYDAAVSISPPFPELYYNRGTARLENGEVEGALADFDYVLEMEPDDLPTRLRRAELLLSTGDLTAAEQDVMAGLELREADAQLLCMLGTILLERNDTEQAAQQLAAALAVDPDYPAALINRAVAHFRLDQPAAAAQVLTHALDVVGADPDVLLNRGLAHAAADDLESALKDFDTALTLPDADVAEIHYQRGLCLTSLHKRAKAVGEPSERRPVAAAENGR